MKKDLPKIVVGVIFGLFIAWLAGLFNLGPPSTTKPATKSTASTPSVPPADAVPAQKSVPASSATAPISNLAQPAPAQSSSAAAVQAAALTVAQVAIPQVRQQSQLKAITNNLRQMYVAGQQYMLDKGVTEVGYYDLVGTGTDRYISKITPVMGEDYGGVYMTKTDTQIRLVAPDGATFTFGM